MRQLSEVAVGDQLGPLPVRITRADLVRYAGVSHDFNPIHWNERVATEAGLPNVVAHGMYTMALAARLVSEWAGDPTAIVDYGVRFTRPVIVPDDDKGAEIEFAGKVTAVGDGVAKVYINASHGGNTVLGKAIALVRLPDGGPIWSASASFDR